MDSLRSRLRFSQVQLDTARLGQRKLEIEIVALEANQRKWYDEWLLLAKVIAMAWVVDRLVNE